MTDVVMINDGAIDEFVAAVLLASAPDVNLMGIVMVDADCIGHLACDAMWKINQLARLDVPITLSTSRGVNPFPWLYRTDCVNTLDLAILRQQPSPPWGMPPDGEEFLRALLDGASEPVTIISTGPITPLTTVLAEKPERMVNVAEVVWMAGAIDVPGNLDPATIPSVVANPLAEWNVFWDPIGSQRFLDLYAGPVTLLPLDISDSLSIDQDAFLTPLLEGSRHSPFARFCYDAYKLVASEPFYRLWDTVTVLYWLRPDLFAPPRVSPIRIETNPLGPMGATLESVGGKPLRLILDFGEGGPADALREIAELIVTADKSPAHAAPSGDG